MQVKNSQAALEYPHAVYRGLAMAITRQRTSFVCCNFKWDIYQELVY